MRPEAANDAAKLFWGLRNVFAATAVRVIQDELFDFVSQDVDFRRG
jgi:hypothetical protein